MARRVWNVGSSYVNCCDVGCDSAAHCNGCRWTPSCCKWCSETAKKPKATPLPLTRLIVVCSAIFVNQFGINMIFPFLPFMIHDFFPYLDKTELGRQAGYLGSSYFIGNFLGSFVWGWMSDKLGRRPVLLFGVLATIACELFFGFSQNFSWAILARFLWGLLNGNIGVVKTYISEICDDTNQAKGFAVVGTSGGIARLLGSVLGGFLARPASKYSALQLDFFCKYPYSLPCLVGGGISFLSLVCTWLFVDETLNKPKAAIDNDESNLPDETNSLDNSSDPPCSSDSGIELLQPRTTDESTLLPNDYDEEMDEMQLFETDDSDYDTSSDTELLNSRRIKDKHFYQQYKRKCIRTFSIVKLARKIVQRTTDCVGGFVTCAMCLWSYDYTKCKPQNLQLKSSGWCRALGHGFWKTLKLMLDRRVFMSVSLYGIIAFLAIISNELLPLLLVTSHEHGGYNMDASEIGVILMVAAILQLFLQFFVFPRIVKCFGYRHTYKLGCVIFGIFSILLPLSNRISGPISSPSEDVFSVSGSGSGLALFHVYNDSCGNLVNTTDNETSISGDSVSRVPARVWVVIMTITGVMIFARLIAITSVMVLIGNSTLPKDRGTINGFGQSTAALGRILGPVIGAPVFAWSETSGKGWPLNYHLMFDLLAVGSFVAIMLCLLLPASIEKKRENHTTIVESDLAEKYSTHSNNTTEDETLDEKV